MRKPIFALPGLALAICCAMAGAAGLPGSSGAFGAPGASGASGVSGAPGVSGTTPGVSGAPGASSASRLTGAPASAGVANANLIEPFETNSLSQVVERQKGKPFVLMLWSLDCEYCQTSLKTLAQARRKGLRVVTLATDSMDDPQALALMQQRLAALGMRANAWAFGAAPAEQLRYTIDPKWHGEMPRSYWFNARGDKVAHSGVLTPELIGKLSTPP